MFIVPLKIKENLRVVQQLQSELPLISLYQIICRRKLMSVANEIKIKCICICEFVNPIDALVRSNWNWINLQNSKLRFTFCGTCHATCHIEPRLSTFACVLLPLCFMQQTTKFATVCERFFLLSAIHLPWQQNLIVFFSFAAGFVAIKLWNAAHKALTKLISQMKRLAQWPSDRQTDRKSVR